MRTTIDLPEELYREVKSRAALQGVSMREYVIDALERSAKAETALPARARKRFPSFHLRSRRKLDLSGFNFDDLLA